MKLRKYWSTVYNSIVDLFFPRRCPICDGIIPMTEGLCCKKCEDKLVYINEPMCRKCGKPVEEDVEFCFDCTKKHFVYEEGRAVFLYDKYMRQSISKYKYKNRVEYAEFYTKNIVEQYREFIVNKKIDLIVPIPIHRNKLHKRGYNQADVIARKLGKELNIPVMSNALIRVIDTVAMKELDNKQRKANLINAISINYKLNMPKGIKNILLIDDIYTTGATIDVCSRKLLEYDSQYKVYYISVAIGKGI